MTQPVSSVTAVLPKDTVYTVNDSDVKVVDGRPSLLVDEIVSTDNSASGSDYRGVLVDKAVKLVGEGFQNVATQAKYLDLVDAANGNTWIQTDSNVTIYWPYPQGTDANTKFRLVHFDGLDREMTADEVMDAINKNEPVVVKDLVTDQYGIRFETDSFSPFVLVWDNTQTTTVTEEDDHPDIAEAIANGTWGQPTPTPAPAVVPQTGDNMPVMLLVILAVVAAGAIVSMEVNSGEIVGIIGPNGAGKSTLFNVITGMYNPTEGKVEMLGQDVTGWKPYRITELGFSRTFQNIRLFPRMTVQDNVIVGMHTRTKGNIFSGVFFTKKEKEERASCVREADTILRLLGLYEDRFEMGTSLPYGSQRKLEIARALATRPKLLLLDEPAAGMNEQETEELRQIVYRLKEMGYTILLIEHDMKFVMNICERIYVLNNGCMISSGTPDEVRTDPVVIEAYLGKEE